MSRASRRAARERQQRGAAHGHHVPQAADDTGQSSSVDVASSEASITVDFSKLEAPTQAYVADVAWVDYKPGRLVLVFAKKKRNNPDLLQSILELNHPAEGLLSLWDNSAGFFDRVKGYVNTWPIEAAKAESVPVQTAELNHSEWVSFAYLSHSGSQGSLDWYHLAPTALVRYIRFGKVEGVKPRPVVRVQMTTFELHNFIERLRPVVEQVRQHAPKTPDQSEPKGLESGTAG